MVTLTFDEYVKLLASWRAVCTSCGRRGARLSADVTSDTHERTCSCGGRMHDVDHALTCGLVEVEWTSMTSSARRRA